MSPLFLVPGLHQLLVNENSVAWSQETESTYRIIHRLNILSLCEHINEHISAGFAQ